jgi:hypothetical protein
MSQILDQSVTRKHCDENVLQANHHLPIEWHHDCIHEEGLSLTRRSED